MKTKKMSLALVSCAILLIGPAAMAGDGKHHSTGKMESMEHPGMNCPMKVAGVTVEYTEIDEGGSLTFRTESGNVEALRDRVDGLAEMYGEEGCGYSGSGPMMRHQRGRGHHGEMHGHGMHEKHGTMTRMHSAMTKVENVDGGARLLLTPEDEDSLGALREHLKWMAGHMNRMGDCPMMRVWSEEGSGEKKEKSAAY